MKSIYVVLVLCVVLSFNAKVLGVITDNGMFLAPGSTYESKNPVSYPQSMIEVEILSMSLVSSSPPTVVGPDSAGLYQVDSFFDVFTELSIDGNKYAVDSFFDITFRVDGDPKGNVGSWDTEMVALSLIGDVGGISIEIRESPSLPSPGHHSAIDLGNGQFQVDSFFDVFTEISIDGGAFTLANDALHVEITPEPTMIGLLGIGSLILRRRKRKI